jgi:hypothetical protein
LTDIQPTRLVAAGIAALKHIMSSGGGAGTTLTNLGKRLVSNAGLGFNFNTGNMAVSARRMCAAFCVYTIEGA